MTHTAPNEGWSRRRWFLAISAVTLAQAVLIFTLGQWASPALVRPDNFQVLMAGEAYYRSGEMPALMDPTLFARANPMGFSGQGWLHIPAVQHSFHTWREEDRWLSLAVGGLGQAFLAFAQTNARVPFVAALKPEAAFEQTNLVTSRDLFAATSQVRFAGALSGWETSHRPTLPTIVHTDVLEPTRVQLVVDRVGRVLSATPLSSSGSKKADLTALELARQLRFAPPPGAGRPAQTIGTAVFEWQVSAPLPIQPATTNSP
jgi:TonB family protein